VRVLFAPRGLHVGGVNDVFILLAAEMQRRGHEVRVFSHPGPWEERCHALGLSTHVVAYRGCRPWSPTVRDLRSVVAGFGPDVMWAGSRRAGIVAYWGAHVVDGVPLAIGSYASDNPMPFPPTVGLVLGRPGVAASFRHPGGVWAVPPPVDVESDRPGHGGSEFRSRFGIDAAAGVVLAVSRLVEHEKLAGLYRAIDAVGELPPQVRPHLVVVGDGPARGALEVRARELEMRLGGRRVTFCGEIVDVSDAFDAADIVVGRGLGVMRGMAHAKPGIVLDAGGNGTLVGPSNLSHFLERGFISTPAGETQLRLSEHLAPLLTDISTRSELGAWSRAAVVEHRSVKCSGDALESALEAVSRGRFAARARVTATGVHGVGLATRRLRERRADAFDHPGDVALGEEWAEG
jgi:glycosyltransferase involved in cell wall biosynthesis